MRTAAPDLLVGVFGEDPDALTALEVTGTAPLTWRTVHTYPQYGEVVATPGSVPALLNRHNRSGSVSVVAVQSVGGYWPNGQRPRPDALQRGSAVRWHPCHAYV